MNRVEFDFDIEGRTVFNIVFWGYLGYVSAKTITAIAGNLIGKYTEKNEKKFEE